MKTGDIIIKENADLGAIDIFRYQNGMDMHGNVTDEKICSLYSVDCIDAILTALKVEPEEFEGIEGYPMQIEEEDLETVFENSEV